MHWAQVSHFIWMSFVILGKRNHALISPSICSLPKAQNHHMWTSVLWDSLFETVPIASMVHLWSTQNPVQYPIVRAISVIPREGHSGHMRSSVALPAKRTHFFSFTINHCSLPSKALCWFCTSIWGREVDLGYVIQGCKYSFWGLPQAVSQACFPDQFAIPNGLHSLIKDGLSDLRTWPS